MPTGKVVLLTEKTIPVQNWILEPAVKLECGIWALWNLLSYPRKSYQGLITIK